MTVPASPPPPPPAASPPTCVRHTQYSASWPHRELRVRAQWWWLRASATPSTALRGPLGRST
eukprot:7615756-Pyramimonas_sp.AAC.1